MGSYSDTHPAAHLSQELRMNVGIIVMSAYRSHEPFMTAILLLMSSLNLLDNDAGWHKVCQDRYHNEDGVLDLTIDLEMIMGSK